MRSAYDGGDIGGRYSEYRAGGVIGGGPASAGPAVWFHIPTSTWRRRKEDGEVLVSDPVMRIDSATGLPLDMSAFQASKRAALERWRG